MRFEFENLPFLGLVVFQISVSVVAICTDKWCMNKMGLGIICYEITCTVMIDVSVRFSFFSRIQQRTENR